MTEQVKKEIIKAYATGKHLRSRGGYGYLTGRRPKAPGGNAFEAIEERKKSLKAAGGLK